jgi:hypothetical protein
MPVRRPTARLAAILASALLVVACGSSGTAAHTTRSSSTTSMPRPLTTSVSQILSACDLVTPVDITAALGQLPRIPPTTETIDQCAYASNAQADFVSLLVESNTTKVSFEKAAAKGGANTAISGLGDAALQSSDGQSIFVLAGHDSLHLGVNGSSVKPAAVRSLARTALQRLQP